MQVSVERNEGLERKLKVDIPADRIDQAVQKKLNELQRTARLDGFRPGKVPYRVVRDRFGPQAREEVLGELIQSSFQEAVGQESLRPAGTPRIDMPELNPEGGDLSYTATFEVYPEIEIAPLEDLEIERPVAEVADADIDRMIENLREQRKQYDTVERPAGSGDQVVIDSTATVDGEAFEGGTTKDTPVELGAGRMIGDFEERLEGIGAGEMREFEITLPESFHTDTLAGKTVHFEVTAKDVREARLPEADEEFVRGFGVESGSVEDFRDRLRSNMERELSQTVRTRVKQQVLDALVEHNPVDIPEPLVRDEVGRLRQQMEQRLGDQAGAAQLDDNLFEEEGRRRVRVGLILAELVRNSEISADPDRLRAQVEELASAYEDPDQVAQYYYQNHEMMQGVQAMVVEDQVIDHVLERARVTEQSMTFDAVMNRDSRKPESQEGE